MGVPCRRLLRLAACVLATAALGACDPPAGTGSGGGQQEFTVRTLQRAGEGECPVDSACPARGGRVAVGAAVVTAVDTFDEDGEGRTGNVWVQDPGGGSWSGIQLYVPTVIPGRTRLLPGDVVRVVGTLDEFVLLDDAGMPLDRDGTLTELTKAAVQKIGEYLPPEPMPTSDLGSLAGAEPWEGVLVRVRDVRFTGPYDDNGEAPTSAGFDVSNDLYEIPGVADGVTVGSMVGVVTYFFGFKVLPRGPGDVVP